MTEVKSDGTIGRQYDLTVDGEHLGRFDTWELAARMVERSGKGRWNGAVFEVEGDVEIKAAPEE